MAGSKKTYWSGINIVTDTGWGDTGKGKIVDFGAQHADMVIRYNGGPNAGHTIENEKGKFVQHDVPSGIFNSHALSIIAQTVLVNPILIVEEIENLIRGGVKVSSSNLLISKDCHLIMPWHKIRDALTETSRGGKGIGTTGQGIGPTYSDRTNRVGIRAQDLLDPNFEKIFDREFAFQEKLTRVMDNEPLLSQLKGINTAEIKKAKENKYYDRDEILEKLKKAKEILSPMITNTLKVIWKYKDHNKNILGEGAQGALLDLDLGGYPYVTSSHPGVSGFSIATGIQHKDTKRVIGVTKAYSTRVGQGEMPTELHDKTGEYISKRGNEFGATTGRKRRVGWLDIPATRYGIRIAGVDSIALTKIDVLDKLEEVRLGIAYEVGKTKHRDLYTLENSFLENAKVVYETLPGWQKDTTGVRSFKDFPQNAQRFINRIQDLLGLPIEIISVGPKRSATFYH